MRVLVTGAAGFLGSHLCDRLLKDKHDVIALDNLFTGYKRNFAHLLGRHDFEFVRHDVVNPIMFEVDWIFNLACPASPVHYQYNPVKTVKTSFFKLSWSVNRFLHQRIFRVDSSRPQGIRKRFPRLRSPHCARWPMLHTALSSHQEVAQVVLAGNGYLGA